MKKTILLLCSFLMLAAISCKKDSNGGGGLVSGQGYMRGTVDGVVKECDLAVTATKTDVLSLAGRWGGAGGGFTININNYNNGGPGTYQLGLMGSMAIYSDGTAAETQYVTSMVAGSGSVTITEINNTHVKGTFTFTGRNTSGTTKTVSNGEFDINF